jgi:hypothetical protein
VRSSLRRKRASSDGRATRINVTARSDAQATARRPGGRTRRQTRERG